MTVQYSGVNTKLLELLHETLPEVTRVAYLRGNLTAPVYVRTLRGLQATAPALGLTIPATLLLQATKVIK